MNKPLISIVVPCFNQAIFLDECLTSVLEQTFEKWECIIVNDGSPDNTDEIAKKWLQKDKRFSYLKKENGGLSSARNAGIEISRGEYILPLDADDKISSNYIDLAIKTFQEDVTLKVIYCKAEKFGSEYGEWNLKPFSLKVIATENMIFCSAIYRKTDWKKVNGYDEKMIYGWEDWEFWIAILKKGGNVKCLDHVGFYYRIKSNSMIKSVNSDNEKYLYEYISVKHADFFVNQLGSFNHLNSVIVNQKNQNQINLKSEKFVVDLFCKTFFKFTIFGKYKKQ